jgi:hypothetical protein
VQRTLCFLASALVVALIIAATSPFALADTILTYTGSPFATATGAFSTSDFLTVTIDLASPLLTFTTQTVNPVSFVISDGLQTFTQANQLFAPTFRFSTDGLGYISSWFISAALKSTQPSSAGYEEDIVLCQATPIFCSSPPAQVSLYNLSGVLVGSGQQSLHVNSWTVSTSAPTAVPEPQTLTMLLTSVLAGIGLYSRRRKAARI